MQDHDEGHMPGLPGGEEGGVAREGLSAGQLANVGAADDSPPQDLVVGNDDDDPNIFSFSTATELTKKRKRGRPSKILTELLATDAASMSIGESSRPASSSHPDIPAEAVHHAKPCHVKSQVPENLMQVACRRPDTGAPHHTGYAHTSHLFPVLVNLHTFIAQQGVETDPDIEQMQDFNLNPEKFHLASGNLLKYLWGLEGRSLTQKLNRLAASIMLHSSLSLTQI